MDLARIAITGGAVLALIAIELCVPRQRMPVRWRAIAIGGGLLVVNTFVVHALVIAPESSSTVRIATAWLLGEVFAYWLHRAMHGVPWLWRFHRLHHSPEPMAWHRSWWIHPVDIAMFTLAADAACAIAGAPHTAAAWFLVARRLWSLLLHANVRWPASVVDRVLVTPSFHHRHHREDLPPANFAGNIAWLDRVFGTWRSGNELR